MENQILNCLMANLMGPGKQCLPQNGSTGPSEGQNEFFALFSEKMMNGIFCTMLPPSMNDVSDDTGAADKKEPATTECRGALTDGSQISLLISALAAALEKPALAPSLEEADIPAITEFLTNILDILSGGDEIELKGRAENAAHGANLEKDAGQKGLENAAANSLVGTLAVFLTALNNMARQETEAGSRRDPGSIPGTPDVKNIPQPRAENVPDAVKTATPDANTVPSSQGDAPEDAPRAPAFVVHVTRSANENKIVDISMKELQKNPVFSVPAGSGDEKVENQPARSDVNIGEKVDIGRIIIRVAEKDEPDMKNNTDDSPANENSLNLQGNSQRNSEQQKTEIHTAGKSNFGAAMIDKIERIAEQYSGKNLGMDMTVKLKINDNETILVGLRDEGTSVTVEVKTANENTMNFIHSQKDELMKNLADKHIMTTIHVDIEQDTRGRQQRDKNKENGQDGTEEDQDFGTFFEAMA